MKRVTILYSHLGENAGTPYSPWKEWDGSVDLSTKKGACVSYDNDMLISVDRYCLGEKDLPDWLPVAEYCYEHWNWDRVLPHLPKDCSETYGRGMYALYVSPQWDVADTLLRTKNFRSEFRRKMREQIESWLNEVERKYPLPLSQKQWVALQPPPRW